MQSQVCMNVPERQFLEDVDYLLSFGQGDYEGKTGEARTIKKIEDVKENPHDLKITSGLCLCRFIDILNITAEEVLKAYHFL